MNDTDLEFLEKEDDDGVKTEYNSLETFNSLETEESEFSSMYECSDLVSVLEDAIRNLYTNYEIWLEQRIESIKAIRALATELHGHQKNVDIARVTGTSVGAAATVAGVVFTGLALAPFTAGTSLFIGLGMGAGVVGGAGVGTSLGALLTKRSIEKKRWEVLKEMVEEDSKITDTLRNNITKYDKTLQDLMIITEKKKDNIALPRTVITALRCAHSVAEKVTLTVLRNVIRSAAGVTTEVVEGGAKIALMTSRVLGGIGVALSGISLIFDVIQLVEVSKNISQGSRCKVAERMEEIANVMEEELKEIQDYMEAILREDAESPDVEEEEKLRGILDEEDFNILFSSTMPDIVQNALNRTQSDSGNDNHNTNIQTNPNKSYYMLTVQSFDEDYSSNEATNENKQQ